MRDNFALMDGYITGRSPFRSSQRFSDGLPLATIVGGPLCGAAAAAIMTAVNVAAEVSDK